MYNKYREHAGLEGTFSLEIAPGCKVFSLERAPGCKVFSLERAPVYSVQFREGSSLQCSV